MTVKVTVLNRYGHQVQELSVKEAEQLCQAEVGRYFVVDKATNNVLKEVKLEDNQEIQLIPIARGG